MSLVILDRDGVINQDSDAYIRSLDDWHPIPGSLEAIASLSRAGFTVAVATNQSGLGRGFFGREELESIHARLHQQVRELGGQLAGIFYCPHLPQAGCNCRKPATGLLDSIERELAVSAENAFFVGDSLKDLQAAQAFGCQAVLVRTGKGLKTLAALQHPDSALSKPSEIPVYADLAEASRAILAVQKH